MSKLSFRARALDASKPMPIYLAEELPDLPEYSAINRAVPQMPTGMEKEEESEHHLQRAICTGLIIPTPEVHAVDDVVFYEKCYPPDYKMPKQHIHMQPLWQEQETPEYDIDSEDDRWLKQQRLPELTELLFEQMMDKLERSSGQTVVTLNEAKLLLERSDDVVIAVYDYWLNKRLKMQHPLMLSVRTDSRPGQSTNNPYLAFRRRTEKMQTRKNRKNDESSYEKMLKLRRDLARALTLLELVAKREKSKRDLVKLTAMLADKRYTAGDFAGQMLADIPQSRPTYSAATLAAQTASFRREAYAPHYLAHTAHQPRAPVQQQDVPRQREKRPYKRRKHRHHTPGAVRDSGVYSSSEEESPSRVETASPPDDGPYAFRRKAGCFYEMPTSTLYGDPVDPEKTTKDDLYEHDIDRRHSFNLTSLRTPYDRCVGFARRRIGRGGRVILDRVRTPLDDLWRRLPFDVHDTSGRKSQQNEREDLENRLHRHPKTLTRDYHTSGRHPWRHAFNKHLKNNTHLWFNETNSENSDISIRKRPVDDCSDSSYDSDASLEPVEKEFEGFVDEVNRKWLHFRPKTPTEDPILPQHTDQIQLEADTPLSVEVFSTELPTKVLDPHTTSEFTLRDLYDLPDHDQSGNTDVSEEILTENLGLTDAQVDSILSEADLDKMVDVDLKDKKIDDLLGDLVGDPFLFHGQGSAGGQPNSGRRYIGFGSSVVSVYQKVEPPIMVDTAEPEKPPEVKTEPRKVEVKVEKEKSLPLPPPLSLSLPPPPAPVPTADIIVEEVNEVPHIKVEVKKPVAQPLQPQPAQLPLQPQPTKAIKEETLEEIQLSHGVQLKTVQSKQSPLKKHIITSGGSRRTGDTVALPHIVTVAVSDALKVRLQNHLMSTQSQSGNEIIQNGPFTHVTANAGQAVAREIGSVSVSVAGTTVSPRRVTTPVVLTPALHQKQIQIQNSPVVVQPHTIQHVASNKLKVLHAHPLTQTQRTQLLAQSRAGITQLPMVSLATIEGKTNQQIQLKTPGTVTQFFEIKGGQLGKGPHLVNVVRQPQPKNVARLELNDAKKRQVVATFDGTLKGNIGTANRPHRLSVSVDSRQLVRAALPQVRTPVRHQIQIKNRTIVATPQLNRGDVASTSIALATPSKTTSLPSTVVANLLQKSGLPKSGQKIAISGAAGQTLAANVQAIAFKTVQLKDRRLIAQPRAARVGEIVEATTAPAAAPSSSQESALEPDANDASTNGTVRRRTTDNLPMEVT